MAIIFRLPHPSRTSSRLPCLTYVSHPRSMPVQIYQRLQSGPFFNCQLLSENEPPNMLAFRRCFTDEEPWGCLAGLPVPVVWYGEEWQTWQPAHVSLRAVLHDDGEPRSAEAEDAVNDNARIEHEILQMQTNAQTRKTWSHRDLSLQSINLLLPSCQIFSRIHWTTLRGSSSIKCKAASYQLLTLYLSRLQWTYYVSMQLERLWTHM